MSWNCVQTTRRFQTLVLQRLDRVTLLYMGEAEKHVDSETFNLIVEAGLARRIKYCLWGNVVKDPRYVQYTVSSRIFLFEGEECPFNLLTTPTL